MNRIILFLFLLVNMCNVFASSSGERLAADYLIAILNDDFDSIEKYVDTNMLSEHSNLTLSQMLNLQVSRNKFSKSEAESIKSSIIESGFSEEDLKIVTVGDALIHMYEIFYSASSKSFGSEIINSEVELIGSVEEGVNREHFVFKVNQKIIDDSFSKSSRVYEDTELVTVEYVDSKPQIVHPSKVVAMAEFAVRAMFERE